MLFMYAEDSITVMEDGEETVTLPGSEITA